MKWKCYQLVVSCILYIVFVENILISVDIFKESESVTSLLYPERISS